ncbi:metallophosphoesterase [Mesoterricola silvestris]|uniref:Metallophosphoesterase n=1 Tax=Mesoterricola silvestris TaxID=2927979 RepID=A0AA48GPB3_9BACT|nr:metallophosphoesterase [Mesoterricola silvestris]BDU73619.1 metallophosphoesterase [Mesoterricola silvestris]
MRRLAPVLAILLLAPLRAQVPPPLPAAAQVDDGPHVVWEGRGARVLRWRQGRPEETALPADFRLELDGLPPLTLDPAPAPQQPAAFPLPARIAAISDIHGNYAAMTALLVKQGILAKNLAWAFGKGHLVVLGDTVDRGPQVTEAFWLLRSLERQARDAGGGVHVLLGNHEVMDMKGDLRYLNAKYRALPLSTPYLLGPDTEAGRWLRSLPVMVRFGDLLFVHGGVSPRLGEAFPSLEALNAAARDAMPRPKKTLLGGDGPLWYRGMVQDPVDPAAVVEASLRPYGARTVVVGHTTVKQVTVIRPGQVYLIDAGLSEGRPGELWLQVDGKRWRGLADGTRVPLD